MTLAIGGAFAPAHGVDGQPDETQKSLRASIEALAKETMGEIEYLEDKQSHDATPRRIARVRCAFCSCVTEIHQSCPALVGEWGPAEREKLAIFGWQTNGKQWFCGKTCGERYKMKVRDHGDQPLPSGPRPSGPAYARSLYETAKTVVSPPHPSDLTTPAAPPAVMRAAKHR